jgi:hypothetical protein
MAYASTRLQKVAGRRFCIPASLESATSLHSQETGERDAWNPTLPIVISDLADAPSLEEGADNIDAALEHNDRVYRVSLWSVPSSLFERFTMAMLEPFPGLTSLLALRSSDESALVLPDTFLRGSTARLQSLYFNNFAFPKLGMLLTSLLDLVHLYVWDIPDSSYISPDAIVACISTMIRPQSLHLGFRSPLSWPHITG